MFNVRFRNIVLVSLLKAGVNGTGGKFTASISNTGGAHLIANIFLNVSEKFLMMLLR
jgi:hypothetical protein